MQTGWCLFSSPMRLTQPKLIKILQKQQEGKLAQTTGMSTTLYSFGQEQNQRASKVNSDQQELLKKCGKKAKEADPWNGSFNFVLIPPLHISSDLREQEAILKRKDDFAHK